MAHPGGQAPLGLSLQDLINAREGVDVVARFGVDEACDLELSALLLRQAQGEDRFMVRDPIAETQNALEAVVAPGVVGRPRSETRAECVSATGVRIARRTERTKNRSSAMRRPDHA